MSKEGIQECLIINFQIVFCMNKYLTFLVFIFLNLNGFADIPGNKGRSGASGEISFTGLAKFPDIIFYADGKIGRDIDIEDGRYYWLESTYFTNQKERITIKSKSISSLKNKVIPKPKLIEYDYLKGNLKIHIKGIDKDRNLIVETQYVKRNKQGEISITGLSKFPKLDFYSNKLNRFDPNYPLQDSEIYHIGYQGQKEKIIITEFPENEKIFHKYNFVKYFKPKTIVYDYSKGNLIIHIKAIDKDKNLIVETQYVKRKKKSEFGLFSPNDDHFFNPIYLLIVSFLALLGIYFYNKRRKLQYQNIDF